MFIKGFATGAVALVGGTLVATNTTPVVVFMSCVTIVTITALFRAKRDDVPRVFGAWSTAFGLRRDDESLRYKEKSESHEGDDPSTPRKSA